MCHIFIFLPVCVLIWYCRRALRIPARILEYYKLYDVTNVSRVLICVSSMEIKWKSQLLMITQQNGGNNSR